MFDYKELLKIEETSDVWDAEIDGWHLWTMIRTGLRFAVRRQEQNLEAHNVPEKRLKLLTPKLASRHATTLAKLILKPIHPEYNALVIKKARNYNIYSYYYNRIEHPLIIDEVWKGNITEDAWANHDTVLMDTFTLISGLGRRMTSHSPQDKCYIRDFVQYACDLYGMPQLVEVYSGHIERSLLAKNIIQELFTRYVIPRLKNKIAIVQQVYYLGKFAVYSRILRDNGIYVIEPQHGVIYPWDSAYALPTSYAKDSKHPIHLYKPDILLTFGDFWNDFLSYPSEVRAVGHPYIAEKIKNLHDEGSDKTVLIISQGIYSQGLAQATKSLAEAYPEYIFYYKLHPEEIGFPERYSALRALKNVQVIDYQSDIHDFIAKSMTVIGYDSTALFEVAMYPQRRVLVLSDGSVVNPLLQRFAKICATIDDIMASFADKSQGLSPIKPEDIWNPDWDIQVDSLLSELASR
ncbi:MAG: hypothetical protein Phog2KO_48240 [Phototrophicaceae bacterium]